MSARRRTGTCYARAAVLRLPVDDVLADVTAAIRAGRDVVVLAPPGAGKTTRVPAAIAEVVEKRVLVLEPRRLAARLAAARLAEELGTTVLLITHDRALADRCARVETMQDGRLLSACDKAS